MHSLLGSNNQVVNAMCHRLCGMKYKAEVFVLVLTLHSYTIEEEILATRLSGFENHNFCLAQIDCELPLLTEVSQCIKLSLKSFWAGGHEDKVISIQQ